jgi:hypothetical protein
MFSKIKFYRILVATLAIFVAASSCFGQQLTQPVWSNLGDIKLKTKVTIQTPNGVKHDSAATIRFSANHAIVMLDGQPPARYSDVPPFTAFDLAKMTWQDSENRVLIDVSSAQAWEKSSIERTKATLSRESDPAVRAFVESMITPNFQIMPTSDGTIIAANSHLRYTVTPYSNVPIDQCHRFFLFDRLNAYQKAMTDRQLPPTAQLAIDDILLRKNIVPRMLAISIKTPSGDVKTESALVFEKFLAEDAAIVKSALATIGQ